MSNTVPDKCSTLREGGRGQPRRQRPGDQREQGCHPDCFHSIHDLHCLLATQIRAGFTRTVRYDYLSTRTR